MTFSAVIRPLAGVMSGPAAIYTKIPFKVFFPRQQPNNSRCVSSKTPTVLTGNLVNFDRFGDMGMSDNKRKLVKLAHFEKLNENQPFKTYDIVTAKQTFITYMVKQSQNFKIAY